jgi:DNA-binding beta-propeller fold protein YncE
VVNDLRISPDGRYAAVTHLIGRYYHPASQVERGWINTNALTLIDLRTMSVMETVLLDAADRGAANPWGLAWTDDGRSLVVAHSGLHEVSLIDFPGMVEKLNRPRGGPAAKSATAAKAAPAYADEIPAEVSRDLTFLATLRRPRGGVAATRAPTRDDAGAFRRISVPQCPPLFSGLAELRELPPR